MVEYLEEIQNIIDLLELQYADQQIINRLKAVHEALSLDI